MFNTRLLAYGEKLPFKGQVVVADPCYFEQLSKPHEKWDQFCNKMFAHGNNHRGPFVFDLNGHTCVTASTKFGDGSYPHFGTEIVEEHGGDLGVDAGLIAIIPREAVDKLPYNYAIYNVNGIFHYEEGNFYIEGDKSLTIITNGDDEEEDDDYEEDQWEDDQDEEDEEDEE